MARPLSSGIVQHFGRWLRRHRQRVLRTVAAAVVIAGGTSLSWFEPVAVLLFREWVWDRFVEVRPRPYDPAVQVRIVDIDEASLAAHGQWPWPRTRIARLVESLADYGVRAAVFDVIFAEPDRTSLPQVFRSLQSDVPGYTPPLDADALAAQPDNDARLATALQALPVVLGVTIAKAGTGDGGAIAPRPLENLPRVDFERRRDQRYLPRAAYATSSLPELQRAAAANAILDMRADPDGVTRKMPLLFKVETRTVPSLAAAAVLALEGGEAEARTREPGLRSVVLNGREVPTDRHGAMRLYDSGSVRDRYVSAGDVLAQIVPLERLRGAIVVVGTGAEGLNDLRLTPLERWVPGMETHAQAIEQILTATYLQRPDWGAPAEAAATLLVGFGLVVATVLVWQRVPPWSIAATFAAGFAIAAWFAFAERRLLLDPILPAATLLAAAMLERLLLVLDLRRERSAVRGAFARYLAPALVEQLADDPDRLRLGGEMRHMTFLFCDVRGFTAISERFQSDPEGLTRLINRFLTPMTDAILARHGTIDKYMGDCIMAFWNAPLPDDRHAEHACDSALAMLQTLDALNHELAAEAAVEGRQALALRIGIGINTGRCVVGNMGSEQRFDYSVLGDSVNLASRLEGQSKTYGVAILLGEDTQSAAPDYAALELDLVAVKGREAPVRVFGLMGDRNVRESAPFQELLALQGRLLAAYRAQDWAAARLCIRECRRSLSARWDLDVLCALYESRIAAFEKCPPGSDWKGVYVAETK